MLHKLCTCAFTIITTCALSQEFTIKKVEINQGKVVLHYTLLDSVHHRNYTVNVYTSSDNFIAPLEKVTGDVGLEVKPGENKKIIWDASGELAKDFNGKVALEIRGRVYIPFIQFDGFADYKAIKRNKDYEMTWSGGTPQNILNFELYKGDKKITAFPNIANVGHYTLRLPSSVKPGKDYQFKITDSKNKDEIVFTSNFQVKRKVPLIVKAIPVVVVGAVVYFLGAGSSSPEQNNDIVGPPEHP